MNKYRELHERKKNHSIPVPSESISPQRKRKVLKRALGLWHVSSQLSNATSKKQVAEVVINEVLTVLGAFNGDIELIIADGKAEVITSKGYPENFPNEWSIVPEDTPLLTTLVIKTKRPYFIKHVDDIATKYKTARLFFTASGAKSASLIPLMIENRVIGVMQFTFKSRQAFTREDRLFMQTLAHQCALAFERVIALENLHESKEQLEIILKSTADGVVVQNARGDITYVNAVAASVFNFRLQKQYGAIRPQNLLRNVTLQTEDDQPFSCFAEIHQAILHGKKNFSAQCKVVNKKTEKVQWLTIKSTALRNVNESPFLIVTTLHNSTREKELDQRKDNFISMASHELKTPLTSLRLFVQLLHAHLTKQEDEKSTLYVEKIAEQTTRLQKLVNDLLDITRIQKGKLNFTMETIRLDELLLNTTQDLQLFASSHRLIIEGISPVVISGDRFRLYQVITNLITNAVKYSEGREKIIIGMKKERKIVTISIQDFGIGIPQEQQAKIFDRFYQVSTEGRKASSGLGMGLFISYEIIKRHGGKLWVDSTEGKGTTFSFSLPITAAKT